MKYAGFLFLAILLAGCIGQPIEEEPAVESTPLIESKEVTPLKDFFVVDLGVKPDIDVTEWRLEITGLVENPLTLTYEEILALPSKKQITTVYCVVGPEATGEWTGVSVKYLLEKAGYSEDTVSVVFYAADEYSSSITLEKALQEDTILAYKLNGVILSKEHGYPLRLVVPDKLGYKWVKWVVKIELVDYEYKGYWESRGYSNVADVPESLKKEEFPAE